MPKLNYNVVQAIGDGNCAFNAFILGLCQKTTLDRLEKWFTDESNSITEFYRNAGIVLAVEQGSLTEAEYFRVIKTTLLELREHDAFRLQKALAPYMRQLACDLKYTASAKADFIPALQAAYFDAKARQMSLGKLWSTLTKKNQGDDIFSRHPLILDKFKKLREMVPAPSEQEERDALATWWSEEGFNLFVAGMRKLGAWAGDAELAVLARHFRVNVQIRTPRYTRQSHYEYGGLQRDHLTAALIDQLVCRGIIEPPIRGGAFLPFILKPEDIRRQLEAIPDVKEVIEALPEEGFKFSRVPNLPAASIDELKSRGLVEVRDKAFVFSAMKQEVLSIVSAISDDRAVIEGIIDCIHDKSPVIVLENLGGHWNMLTKTNEHQRLQSKASREEDLATATERWLKWQDETKEKYKNPVKSDKLEKVAYTLDDGKTICVTEEEQIAGDEALASFLQQEEYARHGKPRP